MRCLYVRVKFFFFLSFFATISSAFAQSPSWSAGFPSVFSGATSIDIKVQTDASGSVYYGIYNAAQTGITATQLKSAALGATNGTLIRKGVIAVSGGSPSTVSEVTLTSGSTYYVYVVAESAGGLMPDAKISATKSILAARMQGFTNYSNPSVACYLGYFPESYYKDNNNYPVLIYLNGDGEMTKGGSANPFALTATGLPQVISQGKEIPMMMIAPQGVWAWDNTATDLNSFIDFIKTKFRIDASRIYLTGISAGGKGVFQYTDVYKTKIRAVVPVSTWPEPTNPANFISVPVWAFMGSSDTYGGLYNWMVTAKSIGVDATFTSYPGGHDPSVWNSVYSSSRGDDIYTWLLTRGTAQLGPPANKPPTSNAGADLIVSLPQSQINITGTASDADGTIASVLWTKISGPATTLGSATTNTLNLTSLTAGSYVFQFAATDNGGLTSVDQMNLTVIAPNLPPVVNAGQDITVKLPLAQILLTGSATDPDGTISSLVWTQVSGPAITLAGITLPNLLLTNFLAGSYTFQLTATDNSGASTSDQITVTVSPLINTPPVVNAGADVTIALPQTQLVLNGNASDIDGTIASLSWTELSGPAVTLTNASTTALTLTNLNAGIYTFQLTGKDNSGASTSDQVVVTVNAAANIPPVVNAGADVLVNLPKTQLVLSGSASDSDGTIASLLWTELSGPAVTLANMTTTSLTVTNLVAGSYVFQLTAKDNSGASTSDQVAVTIIAAPNIAPFVNAGIDQIVTLPLAQLVITGTATHTDGTISSLLWSEVSGPAVTLANASTTSLILTNLNEGTYTFQLSATDNSGATTADLVVVTVRASTAAGPVVNAGGLVQTMLPVSSLVITGTVTDPGATITSSQWTQLSGQTITLSNATTTALTLTNLKAGLYSFRLTVKDNGGLTGSDVVSVSVVTAGDQFPVVNAGPDVQLTLPVNQITLTATASDVEGSLASLLWTQVSGPAATMTNINALSMSLTNLVAGVYVFKFNARDNDYANSWDFATVTVNAVFNNPPVVNAGADLQYTLPQTQIVITGTATDAEGSIAGMLWSQVSGPVATLSASYGASVATLTLTNVATGIYVFQLTGRDNDGVSVSDQMTLVVSPAVVVATPREFDVNITWAWNLAGGTWNDFVTTGGGVVGNSMTLTDITNKTSSITLGIAAPFVDGVNNHGALPGVYPNNVMQYYLRSTNSRIGVLKLSGLDPAKQYDVTIVSSNYDGWYPSDTKLTIGTQSATVNATNNTSNLVNFKNLTPAANGVLTITVAPATANAANQAMINAFKLFEHAPSGTSRTESTEVTVTEGFQHDVEEYASVYPNPAEGQMTVEINSPLTEAQTFLLSFQDSHGVPVYSGKIESQENENHPSLKIDTEFMQPGFYILTVKNPLLGTSRIKVIKK